MDPEEGYDGSRYGAFALGHGGAGLTPGLREASYRQNAMAPHEFTPQSVLSQIGLSPLAQNASAPSMKDRFNSFTGTVMPNTMTGASDSTAETALKLHFAGQERVDDV